MNGKTVEMRLIIFPATSHQTIHGFITIQVADLLRCSEPRWRLHSTPPQPRGRAEEAEGYPGLGGLPRRGGGAAVSGEEPR